MSESVFATTAKHVLVTVVRAVWALFFRGCCWRRVVLQVTVQARRAVEALAKTVDDIGTATGRAKSVGMDVTAVGEHQRSCTGHCRRALGPIDIGV